MKSRAFEHNYYVTCIEWNLFIGYALLIQFLLVFYFNVWTPWKFNHDILEEYAEIIDRKLGPGVSGGVLSAVDNLTKHQIHHTLYRWFVVRADPDDDKFVDCYIAAGAVCLITEDRHFTAVKKMKFPPVQVMSMSEFEQFFNREK